VTEASPRRRLTVAYDGGAYSGWQVQPGRRTVQGEIEGVLARVLGRQVRVTGSGRTDAGVHALGQVAHFDDPRDLPPARLLASLNALLPSDIRARELQVAAKDFHALHSAHAKTYFYNLHLSEARGGQRAVAASLPPVRRATFHPVPGGLDVGAMRRAAGLLTGTRDFTAFSKAMEPGRGTVKSLRAVRVLRIPRGVRVFATADGFLYGMMRMLCGVLVEAGRGRLSPRDVQELLAAGDRSRAPPLLPAHALFLWKVRYAPLGGQDGAAGQLLS
jgi:tRNA pseudouridine38-40 synthase